MALYSLVSNKRDTSFNSCFSKCTHLRGVPHACGVLFTYILPQLATLQCCFYMNTLKHNDLFTIPISWHTCPSFTTTSLYLKNIPPFAIMSSWQHHHYFLLLMWEKCNAVTAHPRQKIFQHLRLKTHDLQQLFPLYIFPYSAKYPRTPRALKVWGTSIHKLHTCNFVISVR
jgi:hypothetical protein